MKTFIPDQFIVICRYDSLRETVTTIDDYDYLDAAIEGFRWKCNYCGSFFKWVVTLTAIDTVNKVSMIIDVETYDYDIYSD